MGYGATSYYSNAVQRPVLNVRDGDRFLLDPEFLAKFKGQEPDWGPVGKFTFKRTYARPLSEDNQETEEFWQCLERIVNGVYTVQKAHCLRLNLPWLDSKAQRSAKIMFQLMWDFKFLPGGRGLWMMGTKYVEKHGSAALNNCSFCTTGEIDIAFAEPFCYLMDFSMLGVGVGSDCRGAGKVTIQQPVQGDDVHVVKDSREGWVDLLFRFLEAYVGNGTLPKTVDYSKVRPYGSLIKGFGGTASGPDPLIRLIKEVQRILNGLIGEPITSEAIVDLCDLVGVCVVAGNVRRSAIIMFGRGDDEKFLNLKNPALNSAAMKTHRWASNNSILADIGMDYTKTAAISAKAGEPGYMWMDNARKYGRMGEIREDSRVLGFNPCQPAWAPVLTPDGIRTIGDIDVGSTVWSGKQWTRVTKKWSTGVKPVIAYKTRAGAFYGTKNHRVVQDGEKIEVKDAENIDIAPVNPEFIDNVGTINPRDVVDGLVLGDGLVHRASNDLVLLIVGKDDQDYFSGEVADRMIEHREGVHDGYWLVDTTIKASELPKTYEREIPERFYKGDISAVRGFLRGLYSANGSVVSTRITLKASSFCVIEQAQQMLSSLGIRSYYTVNKSHDVEFKNGTYTCRESYDLNIGSDRRRFRELVGFLHADKSRKLDTICDKPVSKYARRGPKTTFDIVEREELGEQEVFDITVEADEHTYWTGGLLVSNCAEISLESAELCVGGSTNLQLISSVGAIKDHVGEQVKVWNGDTWSEVTPRITGRDRELYRVTLSDGSYLDCTANHGWHVQPRTKRVFRRVETKDLSVSDKVVEFELGSIAGRENPYAYEMGFFAGDGYVDQKTAMAVAHGKKLRLRDEGLIKGRWRKEQHPEGYAEPFARIDLSDHISLDEGERLRDKEGIPEFVFSSDKASAMEFVAGYIDADGTVTNKGTAAEGYRVYGSEGQMRGVQMLLRRAGVNHSTIRLFAREGEETNFGVRSYDLWYCQIPSFECGDIPTRLKKAESIGQRYRVNPAHPDGKQIDRARKQRIVSVEKLDGLHTTYCFDEPENHMAVFGNALTYQCNLVETFPSRHASYEEFERTLKFAYLYAKTVSLIPTHNPKTNMVTLRNRRIGVSQSGIIQSFKRHGRRRHFEWCDRGYNYIQKTDRLYSEWLCIRKSIKTTTVKPAGCRPLGAYVTTDQGILTLGEIMNNHPFDQDWHEVEGLTAAGIGERLTKTYRRGLAEVYELVLRNGRKLISTPNHPWSVEGEAGLSSFVRTDQISTGQRIVCRPGVYESEVEHKLQSVNSTDFHPNANTNITQPRSMTSDLGWIIGALYGNGSFSASKHRVRFVHGDLPVVEHYKVLMQKLFAIDIPIGEDSRGGRYYCDIGNKLLFQWFEANGLRKPKSKLLAGVPSAIRRSSKTSILAFIAGYADTDGCFSRGSFCVDSASEDMIRSLQVVAEAVGISMSVTHNTMGSNFQAKKSIWKAHASRVHTTDDARKKLNSFSMKAHGKPMEAPKRLNGNQHPYEVISVRRLKTPVYTGDVEVESAHCFHAGGLLSHNTTSLLPGVTPGIHYEHAEYYFRTVRIAAHSPLVEEYRNAGYRVEADSYDKSGRTSVIYFPIKAELFERGKSDVSIWEQMENAAKMQKYWSDNSVSITVSFKPEEGADIQRVLELYESRLKTVSFLPLNDHGYAQAPYITIDEATYSEATAGLSSTSFTGVGHDADDSPKFCDGDKCIIPVRSATTEQALP